MYDAYEYIALEIVHLLVDCVCIICAHNMHAHTTIEEIRPNTDENGIVLSVFDDLIPKPGHACDALLLY